MEVSHDLAQEHFDRGFRVSRARLRHAQLKHALGGRAGAYRRCGSWGKPKSRRCRYGSGRHLRYALPRRRLARIRPPRKEASQERMPARQERKRLQSRKKPRRRPSLRRRQKSPPRAKSRPLPPSLTRLKARARKKRLPLPRKRTKTRKLRLPPKAKKPKLRVRPRRRRSRPATFRSPPTRWPRRHLRRSSKTAHAAIRPAPP